MSAKWNPVIRFILGFLQVCGLIIAGIIVVRDGRIEPKERKDFGDVLRVSFLIAMCQTVREELRGENRP